MVVKRLVMFFMLLFLIGSTSLGATKGKQRGSSCKSPNQYILKTSKGRMVFKRNRQKKLDTECVRICLAKDHCYLCCAWPGNIECYDLFEKFSGPVGRTYYKANRRGVLKKVRFRK